MVDISSKKILLLDVDDTVCPSTKPASAEMAAELRRLIQSSRVVAFISGSTVEQIWGQLSGGLKNGEYHLLGASGTSYVHVKDAQREEIYHFAMKPEERARIVEAVSHLARTHSVRTLTTEADQIQDRGSQITFSAIGRSAPEALKRSFDPAGQLRQAWASELKKELGPAYSVSVGGTTSIDITRAGLDKGWGIKEFLKVRNLNSADAVFFGDKLKEGGNDYPAWAVVDCVEVRNPEDTLGKLRQLK